MVYTWRRSKTDTCDPVNVMGLFHGDMISRSNGQINHSVDDTLSVLDLWELHGLLLGRISSFNDGVNCACGISRVFRIF